MSPAHIVRERGTWRAVATVVVAVVVAATHIAGVWSTPSLAGVVGPQPQASEIPAPSEEPRPKAERPKQPVAAAPKKKRRPPTIEEMIRSEFGARGDQAVRVARCESKLDPRARSRAGAAGVFQLMPVHSWRITKVKGKHLYDARTNIKVARDLHRDEGWRPWVCARILGLTA